MMQRKCLSRIAYSAAALVFFLCFWLTPMSSAAAADGTLTLICKEQDTVLPDMPWKLYRVGDYHANGELVLDDDFADYPVSGKLDTTAAVQDAADTLANLAAVDAIPPLATGKTDANGTVSFAPLETGVYLITGKPVVVGEKRYIPAPALLHLTTEDGSTTFNWNAYPKFTVRPFQTSSSVMYTLSKVWLHDENQMSDRPADLLVQLYCNDQMMKEITLNAENNWSYSWEASELEEWHVKEVFVPDNYLVVYKQNETQFLIVNSHNDTGSQTLTSTTTDTTTTTTTTETITTSSDTGTETTSTSTEITTTTSSTTLTSHTTSSTTSGTTSTTTTTTTKLPATGQLWWPVPCMAVGGLVLMGVGWRMDKKED